MRKYKYVERYVNPIRWKGVDGWHVEFPPCPHCKQSGLEIKILKKHNMCLACFKAGKSGYTPTTKIKSGAATSSEAKKRRRERSEIRKRVIEAYGHVCACCGIDEFAFLTVDHIYNDGADERRFIGGGYRFYMDLWRRGCPKDRYQVLCQNCNWAKWFEGICPHKALA